MPDPILHKFLISCYKAVDSTVVLKINTQQRWWSYNICLPIYPDLIRICSSTWRPFEQSIIMLQMESSEVLKLQTVCEVVSSLQRIVASHVGPQCLQTLLTSQTGQQRIYIHVGTFMLKSICFLLLEYHPESILSV